MAENCDQQSGKKDGDQQGGKKDWSRVDSVLSSKPPPATPGQLARTPEATLAPAENFAAPTPLMVPQPDLMASQGFIAKFKANQLGRKAMLEQLQTQYNGQLEVLKETVSQAVKVHKSRIGVAAEEYLRTLDSKHLELLTQLGMRNAATRWKAVTDLTDMAVAKINEVESKNWPQRFIDDTIEKIFTVRERVAGEIMKELGIEHSQD